MCLPHTAETVRARAARIKPRRADRRTALKAGAALAALGTTPVLAGCQPLLPQVDVRNLRDLTHTYRVDFPAYADPGRATRRTVITIEDNGFYAQEWTFVEHFATHLDAPGHITPGARLAPDIRPEELVTPMVVIDISDKASRDPNAQVTVDDLSRFEGRHGRIPKGAAVCMYSGWETKAGDENAYRGTDASGVYHFPGFSHEAAQWLLEQRRIASIGVDTLSLDFGSSTTFDVHHTFLGADKYGLENLANLATVPPQGAWMFVGLIPWQEGSGGPCRVLAGW
jgi:kynurenine formamidase